MFPLFFSPQPDESTSMLLMFFVISSPVLLTVYIYSYVLIIASVLCLSQALASHRAYLLTARIPAKVRAAAQCTVIHHCLARTNWKKTTSNVIVSGVF